MQNSKHALYAAPARIFSGAALCVLLFGSISTSFAQPFTDSVRRDTTRALEVVTVHAYGRNQSLKTAPASIAYIGDEELRRQPNGLLPALNTAPGVRMEERSPGSFRLSIRGSTLRSPFGVRNVKVYYNGIPVTDPSGFTYFNMFSLSNIESIEILKGPAGSVYGNGNGGVLFLNSISNVPESEIHLGAHLGAFGTGRIFAGIMQSKRKSIHYLRAEVQQTDGYRRQSAMQKYMLAYDNKIAATDKTEVQVNLLFNDLRYQTPGALTANEYREDPRQARPVTNSAPGAEKQNARVSQQNALAGVTGRHTFNKHFSNTTTAYFLYSEFDNASIRNYSKTVDPHFGARSMFSFEKHDSKGSWRAIGGAEAQKSYSRIQVYGNKSGAADSMQSDDKIVTSNTSLFAQLTRSLGRWTFEGGLSWNNYSVNINEQMPAKFRFASATAQVAPRIAASFRWQKNQFVHMNFARGYSTPTTAELAPGGSGLNKQLRAEYGLNGEIGLRGTIWTDRLNYELSGFRYELTNAIVQRKDSSGGDYYTNSGNTQQTGLEAKIKFVALNDSMLTFSNLGIQCAYTFYDFNYGVFAQAGQDFSGNMLPGTPKHTVNVSADLQFARRWMFNVNYFCASAIALHDANTAFADAYQLLNVKLEYTLTMRRTTCSIYIGADNLLNKRYSLGNDINAAGGRYYNAAAPLNCFAGFTLRHTPTSRQRAK